MRYLHGSFIPSTERLKDGSTKHLDDPMQVLPDISRIAATVRLAVVERLPKWQEARGRWLAF